MGLIVRFPPPSRYGDQALTVQAGSSGGRSCTEPQARPRSAALRARYCHERATRTQFCRSLPVAASAMLMAVCASC
jgi:hypothetical protein